MSTIKAPIAQIARFAAYHLDLGAHRIVIHLDVPDPSIADRLAHERVQFVQCDADYWIGRPERTTNTHQMRQIYNASRIYRSTQLDWLAHIDVDEFLLPPAPIPVLLADVPETATHVEVLPVEMMACAQDPYHFKRPASEDLCKVLFPEFGEFAPAGFIGTGSPKCFARTGLQDVRLGIHAMRKKGSILKTGITVPGFDLGHAHAPDYETFCQHLRYRLEKGSYHHRKGKPNKRGLLIEVLLEDDDPDALRRYYDELAAPTPERLDLLRRYGKLRTETLDLEAKVLRHFGRSSDAL